MSYNPRWSASSYLPNHPGSPSRRDSSRRPEVLARDHRSRQTLIQQLAKLAPSERVRFVRQLIRLVKSDWNDIRQSNSFQVLTREKNSRNSLEKIQKALLDEIKVIDKAQHPGPLGYPVHNGIRVNNQEYSRFVRYDHRIRLNSAKKLMALDPSAEASFIAGFRNSPRKINRLTVLLRDLQDTLLRINAAQIAADMSSSNIADVLTLYRMEGNLHAIPDVLSLAIGIPSGSHDEDYLLNPRADLSHMVWLGRPDAYRNLGRNSLEHSLRAVLDYMLVLAGLDVVYRYSLYVSGDDIRHSSNGLIRWSARNWERASLSSHSNSFRLAQFRIANMIVDMQSGSRIPEPVEPRGLSVSLPEAWKAITDGIASLGIPTRSRGTNLNKYALLKFYGITSGYTRFLPLLRDKNSIYNLSYEAIPSKLPVKAFNNSRESALIAAPLNPKKLIGTTLSEASAHFKSLQKTDVFLFNSELFIDDISSMENFVNRISNGSDHAARRIRALITHSDRSSRTMHRLTGWTSLSNAEKNRLSRRLLRELNQYVLIQPPRSFFKRLVREVSTVSLPLKAAHRRLRSTHWDEHDLIHANRLLLDALFLNILLPAPVIKRTQPIKDKGITYLLYNIGRTQMHSLIINSLFAAWRAPKQPYRRLRGTRAAVRTVRSEQRNRSQLVGEKYRYENLKKSLNQSSPISSNLRNKLKSKTIFDEIRKAKTKEEIYETTAIPHWRVVEKWLQEGNNLELISDFIQTAPQSLWPKWKEPRANASRYNVTLKYYQRAFS